MADITWSDVTAVAPELSSVSAGAQTIYLAHANDALDPDEIDGETGPDTKLARIYLAAHAATLASNAAAGASGPLTGRSAGGLSETFSAGAPSLAASYGATAYGQALAALLRMHTAAMPRVL
jgi:hypothetical protein